MKLSWLLPAVVGASGAVHAAVSSPTASRAVTDTPGIDKDVGLDTSRIVCVTGVSGYVASVLAAHLDERGYAVHGTVRDLDKYLRQPEFDNYSLFEAELLDDASFDAAFASCHVVMHTASPFFRDVEDPQRDLVDPAVNVRSVFVLVLLCVLFDLSRVFCCSCGCGCGCCAVCCFGHFFLIFKWRYVVVADLR